LTNEAGIHVSFPRCNSNLSLCIDWLMPAGALLDGQGRIGKDRVPFLSRRRRFQDIPCST
jgi:hypothetical protein